MRHVNFFFFVLSLALLLPPALRAQATDQDTLLFDFGDTPTAGNWNNLSDFTDGSIPSARTKRGFPSGYGLTVTNPFRGVNTGGTAEPDPALGLPASATGDSFFGNGAEWGGMVEDTGAVQLTALMPDKAYTLSMFGSRTGTQTRQTKYIVIGNVRDTLLLDAGGNTADTVMTSLLPAPDGTITLQVAAGPDNDTNEKFYYLNALVVNYAAEEPPPMTESQADTFLVDFGNDFSPSPWNNLNVIDPGATLRLMDQSGQLTDARIVVTDGFRGVNILGTQEPAEDLGFPATATGDSFYGNALIWNGRIDATAAVDLRGLDPREAYQLRLFASHTGAGNRETEYVVSGLTTDSLYLNASGNTGTTVGTTLFPGRDSTITIRMTAGPNNDNSRGYFYLNALELTTEPAVIAALDTVIVDFGGGSTSPRPTNNVTDPAAGAVADLTNTAGFFTGYSIMVVDSFNGINTDGTGNPLPGLELPVTATGDSFYGNTAEFNNQSQPTGAVELTGLDTTVTYTVELFASRTTGELRQTQYVVQGRTTDTLFLNVSSNSDRTVYSDMVPDALGRILVTASSGPENQNSFQFYYLGVLRLIYPDTEPFGGVSLALTNPNGGEYWQAGKTAAITWDSRNLATPVALEYSTDAGDNWNAIDTVEAISGTYDWLVPAQATDEALVRITADTLTDKSDTTFTISLDTTTCTIVVLGSSTAEGIAGTSSIDSSWVGRYRNYLADDTRYRLVNLARGGFTTYNILPTGTDIPAGVNQTIDTDRNVTAALGYDPFAIIINMPSNDAASGYPAEDQLENFATTVMAATDEGVKVYVATTQPRNFADTSLVAVQTEVRDSIYRRYGDRAIDFWTGIADSIGFIADSLNSGDGVHLNDAGQRILYQRVIALGLDTIGCSGTTAIRELPRRVSGLVKAYPNPVDGGYLMLNFGGDLRGTAEVQLIDVLGRVRLQQQVQLTGGADHRLDLTHIGSGKSAYYFCVVTINQPDGLVREVIPLVIR